MNNVSFRIFIDSMIEEVTQLVEMSISISERIGLRGASATATNGHEVFRFHFTPVTETNEPINNDPLPNQPAVIITWDMEDKTKPVVVYMSFYGNPQFRITKRYDTTEAIKLSGDIFSYLISKDENDKTRS